MFVVGMTRYAGRRQSTNKASRHSRALISQTFAPTP